MYRRWIRRRTRLWKPLKSVCPAPVERSPSVKVQSGLRPSNFRSLESIRPLEKLCSSSPAPVAMRSGLASDRYGSRISEQAPYGVWILAASRRLSRSEKSRSVTSPADRPAAFDASALQDSPRQIERRPDVWLRFPRLAARLFNRWLTANRVTMTHGRDRLRQ